MAGGLAIGCLGDVVFQVSHQRTLTFESVSRTSVAVFADHPVVNGKPASEFTGEELDTVRMKLTFNATLGISPREEADRLRGMKSTGNAYPLIIGSDVWGNFTIREIGQNHVHSLGGEPLVMSVTVDLKEYEESQPSAGDQACAKDAASRGTTGRGGPVKVNGASAPLQERNFRVTE